MESDEIEMTKEEFRTWVRARVEENELMAACLKEQYSLLQSLLEKREKQAIHLRKVCESLATCEAIVKKQYSLLGWEYRDTDLDDSDDVRRDCGSKIPNPFELDESASEASTSALPRVEGSENLYTYEGRKVFINPNRQPVVVLTRLTPREISSFHRSKPKSDNSGVEYLSGSDTRWDSAFRRSRSSDNTQSHKRRQMCQMIEKLANTHAPPKARGTSSPKRKAQKTQTEPASNMGNARIMRSAVCKRSATADKTQDPHVRPDGGVTVGMNVLCKRTGKAWEPGKMTKLLTEDQHVEWLYRGSPRLHHIISMKKDLEAKKAKYNHD